MVFDGDCSIGHDILLTIFCWFDYAGPESAVAAAGCGMKRIDIVNSSEDESNREAKIHGMNPIWHGGSEGAKSAQQIIWHKSY